MKRNTDIFPFKEVLECISDAKQELAEVIDGIESTKSIEADLEEKIEFSNTNIPQDYLEEVYDTDEEALEESFEVFKEHIYKSIIEDIKRIIKNYVFSTAWIYDKYFGDIDSIKNQYSILKDIECKNIETGYTDEQNFYEVHNESIEAILKRLRMELMNITDGQILLDKSFTVCDITIEINESIEELNKLYEGKGWVEEFINKWEENYVDLDLDKTLIYSHYEYDDVMEEDEYTIDIGCLDNLRKGIESTLKYSYNWDNLESYVDRLIRIQPSQEYINQLNIFLESRFNMINDKLKDIRFEVHW